MDRFFHRDITPAEFTLEESEGRHLAQVLRKEAGELVEVFDGQGASATARIASIGKKGGNVVLARTSEVAVDPVATPSVCVAAAVPKGERFKWMIEKLTEIDVDELQLLSTRRSVAEPGADRVDKLTALVVAACKQSRRNRLLRIHPVVPWSQFLKSPEGDLFLCNADGSSPIDAPISADASRLIVAVGPEGGWTAEEVDECSRCCSFRGTIALSSHILRVETAAILGGAWAVQRRVPSGEPDSSAVGG